MTEPLSFKGCRTRTEALERAAAWFDRFYDDQVRTVAARWVVDDGRTCDPVAFQRDLAQLRAAFTGSRADALAALTRTITEAGLP